MASSNQRIALTCTLLDGSQHVVHARPTDTVGHLQQRIATTIGLNKPTLCCDGVLLADASTVVASFPSHQLAAWSTRYTRSSLDEEDRLASARHRAAAAARSAPTLLLRDLPRLIMAAVPVFKAVPIGTWVRLVVWLSLSIGASYGELLGPWLIATATYLVYQYGFDERAAGQESAYTVFNGLRALPGQLRAEDIQRDMVQGVAGGFM